MLSLNSGNSFAKTRLPCASRFRARYQLSLLENLKMAEDRVKQVVSVLKDALASIENVTTSTDDSSGSSTA